MGSSRSRRVAAAAAVVVAVAAYVVYGGIAHAEIDPDVLLLPQPGGTCIDDDVVVVVVSLCISLSPETTSLSRNDLSCRRPLPLWQLYRLFEGSGWRAVDARQRPRGRR